MEDINSWHVRDAVTMNKQRQGWKTNGLYIGKLRRKKCAVAWYLVVNFAFSSLFFVVGIKHFVVLGLIDRHLIIVLYVIYTILYMLIFFMKINSKRMTNYIEN